MIPASPAGQPRRYDKTMFLTDSILPPDPDGAEPLHDREYRVRAFRLAADRLLLVGAVRDQKPPGMYIAEDPDPLTMHHMVVELEVEFPSLLIARAEATLNVHPHGQCPAIEDRYGLLVGHSISRGFTHRVRELLGGPRGCTHTTALVQAMAPVAVQCFWSMQAVSEREQAEIDAPVEATSAQTTTVQTDAREAAWRYNVGSCHVWDADGELVATAQAGEPVEVPLSIDRRLRELGRDPTELARRRVNGPRQ